MGQMRDRTGRWACVRKVSRTSIIPRCAFSSTQGSLRQLVDRQSDDRTYQLVRQWSRADRDPKVLGGADVLNVTAPNTECVSDPTTRDLLFA